MLWREHKRGHTGWGPAKVSKRKHKPLSSGKGFTVGSLNSSAGNIAATVKPKANKNVSTPTRHRQRARTASSARLCGSCMQPLCTGTRKRGLSTSSRRSPKNMRYGLTGTLDKSATDSTHVQDSDAKSFARPVAHAQLPALTIWFRDVGSSAGKAPRQSLCPHNRQPTQGSWGYPHGAQHHALPDGAAAAVLPASPSSVAAALVVIGGSPAPRKLLQTVMS